MYDEDEVFVIQIAKIRNFSILIFADTNSVTRHKIRVSCKFHLHPPGAILLASNKKLHILHKVPFFKEFWIWGRGGTVKWPIGSEVNSKSTKIVPES
jgi:hypothetical protein